MTQRSASRSHNPETGSPDLADAADVSTSAIVRLERGEDLLVRTANAVRAALEAKGVEFATDGGVTLTEKRKASGNDAACAGPFFLRVA